MTTDVFTKKKRSQVMSRIRGKGNLTTEVRFARLLRRAGVTGWRRHLPLPGRPDFAFPKVLLAVFVDGCFWHGCPRCYHAPRNNQGFWREKITSNRRRDRRVNSELRDKGWASTRIRECALRKRPEGTLSRFRRLLNRLQD